MSKEQVVLAIVAYHVGSGRWGVKNAAGDRVGEFIGSKEEAQAEAQRLTAELEAANLIVIGGGESELKPMTEEQLRQGAAELNIEGHDTLPLQDLKEAFMAALQAQINSKDLAAGAGDNSAGDAGAGNTGQDAPLLQPGEQLAHLAGMQDQDGNVLELRDMPEEQLRQLANDMRIAYWDTLPLDQLIWQIQAESVVVTVGAYTVNRERLDHDGESYTFGEPIEFADAKQAEVLLLLGAIKESE